MFVSVCVYMCVLGVLCWALQDVLRRGMASAAGVINRRHCTGFVNDRGIDK